MVPVYVSWAPQISLPKAQTKHYDKKTQQALKQLANFQHTIDPKTNTKLYIDNPTNFPHAKHVLTVLKVGGKSLQVWDEMKEANNTYDMPSPLCVWHDPKLDALKKQCKQRVPVLVHPSMYRCLKTNYPGRIGGLSRVLTITKEMGAGNVGSAVGVLTPSMFLSGDRHQEA